MSNGHVSSAAAKTGANYANTAHAPVENSEDVLSTAAVEQIIVTVRASVHEELERHQALVDAVTLAAEQVQDKRIELLESPPPVKGGELVVSVLLTVALESNLVGKVVASCTKKVLLAALKRNAVFKMLPKSQAGQELVTGAKRAFGSKGTGDAFAAWRKFGDAMLQRKLIDDVKADDLSLYSKEVAGFVAGAGSEVVPFAKGAREASRALAKQGPAALDASDTTGTALRIAAMDYASNQKAYDLAHLAVFEGAIRSTPITSQHVEILKDTFGLEFLGLKPWQIRNDLRILFEAVIWARLHNFNRKVGPRVFINDPEGKIEGIDPRLAKYWQVRFAEAVKRWGKEVKRGTAVDYDSQTPGTQSAMVQHYFFDIADKTPAGGFAALQE
jgi:hypothetical protein